MSANEPLTQLQAWGTGNDLPKVQTERFNRENKKLCLPGRHIFVTDKDHCIFCPVKKGEESGIEDNSCMEEYERLTQYRKSLLRQMKYNTWKEVCDAVKSCPKDYRPTRKDIHS